MSRKEVSMIGNLTRDMMRDVMETSLKKPIQTGEFRKIRWNRPGDVRVTIFMNWFPQRNL